MEEEKADEEEHSEAEDSDIDPLIVKGIQAEDDTSTLSHIYQLKDALDMPEME